LKGFVAVPESPLAPGVSPAHIHYRDAGHGPPIVFLHGGWGYAVYPFDRQQAVLQAAHRIVIPDRTGYGASGTLGVQEVDFHQRAAEETLAVMDALAIERPVLWGHSDGAVIALRMGLMAPRRVGAIIAEATHFFRKKPASRAFFEMMRDAPEKLGDRVVSEMRREHGDRWRALLATNGAAWLRIGDESATPDADLYEGRLSELQVPTMIIHGGRDPRTEPGELEALRAALDGKTDVPRHTSVLPDGGHSPHSERATADQVTGLAVRFLAGAQSTRP
jgi:pimeloyl-ACP methyl ester carboxylesterase